MSDETSNQLEIVQAEPVPASTPAPTPKMRVIPVTMHLRVPATAERANELLQELHEALDEKKKIALEKKIANEGFAERFATVEAKISEVDDTYANGCKADVKCEKRIDYTNATVTVVRLDTSETLETRPLTHEDRQAVLGFTEPSLAVVAPLEAPVGAPESTDDEPARWGLRIVTQSGNAPELLMQTIVDPQDGETEEPWTWGTESEARTRGEYLATKNKWLAWGVEQVGGPVAALEFVVRWHGQSGNSDLCRKDGLHATVFATLGEAEAFVAEQAKNFPDTDYGVEARSVTTTPEPAPVAAPKKRATKRKAKATDATVGA